MTHFPAQHDSRTHVHDFDNAARHAAIDMLLANDQIQCCNTHILHAHMHINTLCTWTHAYTHTDTQVQTSTKLSILQHDLQIYFLHRLAVGVKRTRYSSAHSLSESMYICIHMRTPLYTYLNMHHLFIVGVKQAHTPIFKHTHF